MSSHLLFLISSALLLSLCLSSTVQAQQKVQVSLYYESLCPGCQEFILTQIHPTLQAEGVKDIIDLHLVAYGNAKEVPSSIQNWYNFTCQHGVQECVGNLYETCVIDSVYGGNGVAAFPFIYCVERALHSGATSDPAVAASKCAALFQIDFTKVDACAKGAQGNQLMHKNAVETASLNPPHKYVPWILVNGVHSEVIEDAMTSDMLGYVCKTYQGNKPAGCKQALSELKDNKCYRR